MLVQSDQNHSHHCADAKCCNKTGTISEWDVCFGCSKIDFCTVACYMSGFPDHAPGNCPKIPSKIKSMSIEVTSVNTTPDGNDESDLRSILVINNQVLRQAEDNGELEIVGTLVESTTDQSKKYRCTGKGCTFEHDRGDQFVRHLKTRKHGFPPRFPCPGCGRPFTRQNSVTLHQKKGRCTGSLS